MTDQAINWGAVGQNLDTHLSRIRLFGFSGAILAAKALTRMLYKHERGCRCEGAFFASEAISFGYREEIASSPEKHRLLATTLSDFVKAVSLLLWVMMS